ncbi:unnamed protein product [Pedinophyceae sp. YPF-701]|nr:unnamed protein product [Pedinophyceae sp. YPF-701]
MQGARVRFVRPRVRTETSSLRRWAAASLAGLTVLLCQCSASDANQPLAQSTLRGVPRVVDGDTLVISRQPRPEDPPAVRLRLRGIDAPESAQTCLDANGREYPCGEVATAALKRRIAGREVECEVQELDRYGRGVATCRDADGADLNAWMVEQGHAVAYREYAKDYVPQEEAARKRRRGVWQGSFQYPADFRREKRGQQPRTSPAVANGPCEGRIKGNVSASGKLYHKPGGKYYDEVVIDVSKGERWFCSPEEAEAAGWREAKE